MRNNPVLLILSLYFGLYMFGACQSTNKINQPTDMEYPTAWKQVDSLENEGLPRSAKEIVDQIYTKAKAENQTAQTIKALTYQLKYQQQLEETGWLEALQRLRTEADNAEFPEQPILQSMLGEAVANYMDQHSWQFQDRTTVVDNDSDDLSTWSLEQLAELSTQAYLASLVDERSKQVDLSQFEPVVAPGENTKGLRPTLYDFLAFRALDHFSNQRSYLTQPANRFYLNDATAFAPVAEFVNWQPETKDTAAYQLRAVEIYQEVLGMHANLGAGSKAVLLDADLHRLKFMQQYAVMANKGKLYQAALGRLLKDYAGQPALAEVQYALAEALVNEGNSYQVGGPDSLRYKYREAAELCEQTIDQYSEKQLGVQQCKQLITNLGRQAFTATVEQVNLSDRPILYSASYRNVEQVYLEIKRLDQGDWERWQDIEYDKQVDFFRSLKTVQSKTIRLKNEGDYREHRTELSLDALPYGHYVLIGSDTEKYTRKSPLFETSFHVSNLALLHQGSREGQQHYGVVDRVSGSPKPDVEVTFYKRSYNRGRQKHSWEEMGKTRSDKQGLFSFDKINEREIYTRLTAGADDLFLREGTYNYGRANKNRDYNQVKFFLDRSIYRPGQTLYFKALALRVGGENRRPRILPGEDLTVTLHDANGQKVNELKLRSNEYGTVNGAFVLPTGGLRGSMSLRTSWGAGGGSFRVEEYKRPKFEVKIKEPVKAYALNDEVAITGTAKSYAGAPIDGAKVQYRVVREVYFPYFYHWNSWWRPSYNSDEMEITNGVTTTDESGGFTVDFQAIPDPSIDADRKPVFYYKVYADITDITGETRSDEYALTLGYHRVNLSISGEEDMDRSDALEVALTAKNLAGQDQPLPVNVRVVSLDAPKTVFVDRYWEEPDVWTLSESDYHSNFPQYAYKGNNRRTNWPESGTAWTEQLTINGEQKVSLPTASIPVGHYKLIVTGKDPSGADLEQQFYFKVSDRSAKQLPAGTLLIADLEPSKDLEPGRTTKLELGTSVAGLSVLTHKENIQARGASTWQEVNRWIAPAYQIQDADQGGAVVLLSYVYQNRFYTRQVQIPVPWKDKELDIEYRTFRDKLLPGAEERFEVVIKGTRGDAATAEVMAAMYDASLDQFVNHDWYLSPFPTLGYGQFGWTGQGFSTRQTNYHQSFPSDYVEINSYKLYPSLRWFGALNARFGGGPVMYRNSGVETMSAPAMAEGRNMSKSAAMADSDSGTVELSYSEVEEAPAKPAATKKQADQPKGTSDTPPAIRTNLKETVFFKPDMRTDADGNIVISFKMNEALTRWKLLTLAHTKDLAVGKDVRELVTRKELMVVPNPPRFLRQNDELVFTAKVNNLSEKSLSGVAKLELFDLQSGKIVNADFGVAEKEQAFTVAPDRSVGLTWTIQVPDAYIGTLGHRVVAEAGAYSDGEEAALPVLTNRMLVTETLPFALRAGQQKTFTLETQGRPDRSASAQPHRMTLELTSNPVWYAVRAIPYLMEYPYDCSEQIFSRYYANTIATGIVRQNPAIERIFEEWRTKGQLRSPLMDNEELKSALLAETPWVQEAQSEQEQQERIALLFDVNKMADEKATALQQLIDRQSVSGGFSWFPGGRDNWYITQHIVAGFGHLDQMGLTTHRTNPNAKRMIQGAMTFIDRSFLDYYEDLQRRKKQDKLDLDQNQLSSIVIHYLYTRSFFMEMRQEKEVKEAMDYFLGQAEKYALKQSLQEQALLGLALNRFGRTAATERIVKSLDERALRSEELGMYWKQDWGYNWYQLPVETQAMLVELFHETGRKEAVQEMKIWLLKHKQTNHWETTKATALATYALLVTQEGSDRWLQEEQPLEIDFPALSDNRLAQQVTLAQTDAEAGTGYTKVSWTGGDINAAALTIQANNPNKTIAWGGMYWQYFEDLDKISTFEETPLTIKKQLFQEVNSSTGPKLETIKGGQHLEPGDKIIVRVELRVDRPMEYVHLKDMRASGLEPVNVLSQYKWQDGLGYYESTGDLATNFFMDYLPTGTYVFEYPLRVVHRGDYSNGITTAQCMYAPEFSSHSEGVRLRVTK